MLCSDKSLTYLAGLGYNVIRHPDATFAPLKLLGQQKGEFLILGSLDQLVTSSSVPQPAITAEQPAADVNGQSSSSLKIGIGANVLGNLIGALGGNLSASLNYTDATQVEFQYLDVFTDSVVPIDAGAYLKGSHVDAENIILKQYVLGNGQLYLISKIVKSDKFSVKYSKSGGADASVQVPIVQAAVGGSLSVAASGASSATLTFQGKASLPFGFQCFRLGVKDGVLDLVIEKAGGVFGLSSTDQGGATGGDNSSPIVFGTGMLGIARH